MKIQITNSNFEIQDLNRAKQAKSMYANMNGGLEKRIRKKEQNYARNSSLLLQEFATASNYRLSANSSKEESILYFPYFWLEN